MSELVEIVAREIGHTFASLVSGNNQPVMSGDPRDRLQPHIRRRFDDACNEATLATLRAIEGAGYKVVGREATGEMTAAMLENVVDQMGVEPSYLWQAAFDAAPTVGGGDNG